MCVAYIQRNTHKRVRQICICMCFRVRLLRYQVRCIWYKNEQVRAEDFMPCPDSVVGRRFASMCCEMSEDNILANGSQNMLGPMPIFPLLQ